MEDEKKFAVLIDADNVSPKYAKYILDEISNYGVATYKRIYGDWTRANSVKWKDVLLENAISPIQQYSYTTGKNATDSAMIIDAMDILYTMNVDGFCIVSSDSDFTKLAIRLRESGMMVIGMGEEKTPKPFSVACNIFKYLNILAEDDEKTEDTLNKDKTSSNTLDVMTDSKVIEDAMIKIIIENGHEENRIDVGELGSRLVKRYPDFDVRNYGYSKLSKFLTTFDSIELKTNGSSLIAHLKEGDISLKTIESTIIDLIKKNNNCINMGLLNKLLIEKYPNFNIKNYGYSKFSKFINDFESIVIVSSGQNSSIKTITLKE